MFMSTLSKFNLSTITVGFLSLFSIVSSANAAVMNGNFSNGLDNWTLSGDVSISDERGLLTTASAVSEDDFPLTGTPFNFSGNDVTAIADLETFLGVDPFALDPTDSFFGAFEGSAIKQTFTANADESLKLNWNFLTNEDSNNTSFANDTAFVTLVNTDNSSSQVIKLADLSSSLSASANGLGFANETGMKSFSQALTPGEYVLGLTVIDDKDNTVSSALLLNSVETVENDPNTTTPEPATIFALLTTFVLSSKVKRNRR